MFFPVFNTAPQSIVFIVFLISSIFFYKNTFFVRINNRNLWKTYFLITGFIWFSAITFFWSDDKVVFLKEIRPTIAIFIIPFIFLFFIPNLKQKDKLKIYLGFIICMVIYSFMWFHHHVEGVSIYQEKVLNEIPIRDFSLIDKLNYFKLKTYKGWISGIANRGNEIGDNSFFKHYTYISAYLITSILLCIVLIKNELNKLKIVFISILISYFLIFLIYLPSAVNKAFLFFVFLFAVFQLIKSNKWRIIVFLCFLFLGGLAYKERIIRLYKDLDKWEIVSERYRNYDGRRVIDYLRYTIMNCSFEKIKEYPLVGIGLGDYQKHLSECLVESDPKNQINHNQEYNTHSQYLHYLLIGGVINITLFLVCILFFVTKAIKSKNTLLFLFMLLMFLNFGFESYLNRIWGVLFFVLFSMIIPNWKEIKEYDNDFDA
ncbi:hypothetical protein D7030_06925 [Flavobacteriaceae bacterium AU392]|nr:hypothetical protein D1817_01495 [Flavobacteriaceae bacterium]RKM84861.1 hypothetical protein D7030_06925 [Flavobacteriaceae bacterium AU392]